MHTTVSELPVQVSRIIKRYKKVKLARLLKRPTSLPDIQSLICGKLYLQVELAPRYAP